MLHFDTLRQVTFSAFYAINFVMIEKSMSYDFFHCVDAPEFLPSGAFICEVS